MRIKIINQTPPIIEVTGEVEHFTSFALQKKVDKLIMGGNYIVIFDFSKVTYIDSAGIGVLFSVIKKLTRPSSIGLIIQDRNVIRILDLVGIFRHESCSLYASRQEALKAMKGMSKSA